ncbi:hypothetical protein [Candidatus Borrarchaeum sp.]|uniref:hypothetical protein n=1 Tax=Candidatus Borrarchaeum sp. TaxID=2846742 RepID=UPI00257B5790|nr:hypothetical protein [Candidatus Borrarchaeum sp.]
MQLLWLIRWYNGINRIRRDNKHACRQGAYSNSIASGSFALPTERRDAKPVETEPSTVIGGYSYSIPLGDRKFGRRSRKPISLAGSSSRPYLFNLCGRKYPSDREGVKAAVFIYSFGI